VAFQQLVQRRVAAVNRDRPRSFVGTGAFNLVRTDAYRAVGGHLPLRLEVVDDVWLGCLLARAGYRTRVWLAHRDFAVDWGATPRQLVRVVEKNMFAVLRYRTLLALLAVLLGTVLLSAPLLAPLISGPLGCLLTPFTRFVLPFALANSAWVTLRQGGVRWRGTFYPLAQLRRGQVP
jgi:hypothetical protein